MTARTVKIRYFAWVRERVGRSEEDVALPADVATVADLAGWLAARSPEYAHAFEKREIIRCALDQVHVKPSATIGEAREVAFFPPVTGG